MSQYAMGIVYDVLTPQVKAQIIKDLIAVKDIPQARDLMVYYDGEVPELDDVLASLQIKRCPFAAVAPAWVTYQTGDQAVEAPEHATQVVDRDMRVKSVGPTLNTDEHSGFYLAPQGRNISPTLDLNRPMPAWYPGGPNPATVWLWG